MKVFKGWKGIIPTKKEKTKEPEKKMPTWKVSKLSAVLSEELEKTGKERTARAYRTVLNGILSYTQGKDLFMEEISREFLIGYEIYMREKGNSLNTISFYMRNLRAMYNKGAKRGYYAPSPTYLFSEVYTGVDHTPKRAIRIKEIARLKKKAEEADEKESAGNLSRFIPLYYFLFCLYARGMSFVDMVYLQKKNIEGNSIRYCRKKTGQWIEVSLTPELKKIIRFFAPMVKNSAYVFPILKESRGNLRLQYESALRRQNKQLKRVALFCGVSEVLSTHVARHSWATMAKKERVPLEVISESLGHTSLKTTAIYLDSFEQRELDRANRRVARAIKKAI